MLTYFVPTYLIQTRPNRAKRATWVLTGPKRSKWVQKGPKGSKCVQMGPNGPNEAKQDQTGKLRK